MTASNDHLLPKPIRVGIAGLGRSGWNMHAHAIKHDSRFRLVAVTDPVPERRDEAVEHFGCTAYRDYAELIKDDRIELVVVATPSHAHADMAIAALDCGRHVIVEKPMATNLAEADKMLEAAARAQKILTVFQTMRLDPNFLKVREVLDSGVLGPIQMVRIGFYLFQRRRDWQTLRKFGGGHLNNAGSHMLDQALLLSQGEWHDLNVDMRSVATAGDAEDHLKITFRGANETIFDLEISNACVAPLHEWVVMGRYGSLWGRKRQFNWQYYDPNALPPREADEGPARRSYHTGEEIPWIEKRAEVERGDQSREFYCALYQTLREGAPLLVTPQSTRAVVALQDECRARCNVAPD